ANDISLFVLLDESLPTLTEGSVVAITSKVVSLCEGSVAPKDLDRYELIKQHADLYLPHELSQYHFTFTVTNNTIVPAAGIDQSNADNTYVLWPKDPQATANAARKHLREKHGLKDLGIIITD